MHAHSQSYLVKELLLVFLGHYSADSWSLRLALFSRRWRRFALEIVRVVQVAHPHLADKVLSLRVGEVVAFVDLLRIGLW